MSREPPRFALSPDGRMHFLNPSPVTAPDPPAAHEERRFPILRDCRERDPSFPRSVPWAAVEPGRAQALRNHYQTLERLAERGGLSPRELCAVIDGVPFEAAPDEQEARRRVQALAAPLPPP